MPEGAAQEVRPVARPANKWLDEFGKAGEREGGEERPAEWRPHPRSKSKDKSGEEGDVTEVEDLAVPHTQPPRRDGGEEQAGRNGDRDQSRDSGDRPRPPTSQGRLRR